MKYQSNEDKIFKPEFFSGSDSLLKVIMGLVLSFTAIYLIFAYRNLNLFDFLESKNISKNNVKTIIRISVIFLVLDLYYKYFLKIKFFRSQGKIEIATFNLKTSKKIMKNFEKYYISIVPQRMERDMFYIRDLKPFKEHKSFFLFIDTSTDRVIPLSKILFKGKDQEIRRLLKDKKVA